MTDQQKQALMGNAYQAALQENGRQYQEAMHTGKTPRYVTAEEMYEQLVTGPEGRGK